MSSTEELTAEYARRLPDRIESLCDWLQRARGGDARVVARARDEAHRLAGTAGSYGFTEIGRCAGLAESLLDARALSTPRGDRELAAVVTELGTLAQDLGASSIARGSVLGTRLLYVDTDDACHRLVDRAARRCLLEVEHASSAGEAERLATGRRIDIIVISERVSGAAGGFELARRVRALPRLEGVPIAIVSGDSGVATRVAAAHAGASLFFAEPLTESALQDGFTALEEMAIGDAPRVLCLDDDADFLHLMRMVLREEGIRVYTLARSSELLAEVERVMPDVICLDYSMPGFNGLELCKMLRANQRWKEIPVALVTAVQSRELRLAAFEAGCDDVFVKPVIPIELRVRLRSRVERSRLLRARSERDGLTGLVVRRVFISALQARLAGRDRRGGTLSVCLLDLDRFKEINDRFGHLAGDRVLAALGRLMSTRFRCEDLRARWGGEEFAVAFVNESAETVGAVIERTLAEFRAIEFVSDAGDRFSATFSAGVASFPDDAESLDGLLAVADARLYGAKAAGRATVHWHGDS